MAVSVVRTLEYHAGWLVGDSVAAGTLPDLTAQPRPQTRLVNSVADGAASAMISVWASKDHRVPLPETAVDSARCRQVSTAPHSTERLMKALEEGLSGSVPTAVLR
jgi:hypothetical protein